MLREPLFQFVLMGLLLFVLHGLAVPADDESKRIVVSQARIDDMAREYRSQLGRAPTQEQMTNLVDAYVHDEILYREGMARGLGRDDPVIRRRVLQKYQIILEEEAGRGAATDADLAAYLQAHRTQFLRPAKVTFDQVFFDLAGSPSETKRRFEAARRAALAGADPATLGQDTMLPRHVEASSVDLIASDFGPTFAQALAEAPVGRWVGPVPSSYGAHLVRVSAREAPSSPPLEAVRDIVAREWESDRRRRALASTYRELRGDYEVSVKARLQPQLASSQ